ncbi:hypothetical protein HV327_10330 [Citrobacter freundii]|uniref:hypothetical protein n=1 Tax=Citrobacter freundii TaxID=546 RepID=UPI0015E9642B|nr:hypothetical protein [Citrobacter freundii]QLS05965.1 hypothetical protein HV327_10330 [Citrobacter freundii]
MKKAWVIEWDDYENSPTINEKNKVVLFLRGNRSPEYVCDLLEKLYISLTESNIHLGLKYDFAVSNRKEKEESDLLPHFSSIHGIPYAGRMYVGQAPCLVAKLVKNLRVTGDYPDEKVSWDEIPFPQLPKNA